MSSTVAIAKVLPDPSVDCTGLDALRAVAGEITLKDRANLTVVEKFQLEQRAFEFASVPESYDVAVSNGQLLQTPCGQGMVNVCEDGRYWHMPGGLLAPGPLKKSMIPWMAEISRQQNKTLAFYNVSAEDAVLFRDAGFIVNKFGEEPIVRPQEITWSGKQFEWVRRQTNFCRRAGLVVEEVTGITEQKNLAFELQRILTEDLKGRTFDQPLHLLEGQLNPERINRRRLFVARHSGEHRIEGFLLCSPIDAGRSWAFETYRKRKDAPKGTTAFLFRTVIDKMAAEQVETVSLCLIPGRNVKSSTVEKGDKRVQWIMSAWFHRLDFVFNVQGQDHFKSRFRPDYNSRYLCVAPKHSARSIWSFFRMTGATNVNWKNLGRGWWRHVRRKRS